MAIKKFWKRGQMAALARAAKIEPRNLSSILHRRRTVGKDLAVTLEAASRKVKTRRTITAFDWLFSKYLPHPAFFNARTYKTKRKNRKR